MKFNVNGKVYDSRFQYDLVENPSGRMVEQTSCIISEMDQNKVGKERYTIVAQASIVRNVKDEDNRLQARKKVFGKALSTFLPGRANKAEREVIWHEGYLKHIRSLITKKN